MKFSFKELMKGFNELLTESVESDVTEELLDEALGELSLDEQDELAALEEFMLLDEIVKRKALKRDLIARRVGKVSVAQAKASDDPLYKKMKFHWGKFVDFRSQLRQKYNGRAKGFVAGKTKKQS